MVDGETDNLTVLKKADECICKWLLQSQAYRTDIAGIKRYLHFGSKAKKKE